MTRLCVFCGSSAGISPDFLEAARALGQTLAESGIELVYGGASVGLMGAVADAALAAGGRVVGVIPEALVSRELAHRGLSELHVTPSMHARKAMMADLSDGFVALPGGIGTFEELFEIWTWGQLGDHAKPIGLLDVAGFYRPLLAFLDGVVAAGFLRAEHRAMVQVADTPAALLEQMRTAPPRATAKWIGAAER